MRLAFSPVGYEFPRDTFVRTPIKALSRVLDWCALHEKHAANRDSITQAQMAHLLLNVAHGFSGSKKAAPKARIQDFLPYPQYKGPDKESDGPDEATRFVLSEIARKGQIPAYVLAALMKRVSIGG